jgi:hypothetical protein
VNLKRLSSRCGPPVATSMPAPHVQLLESGADYCHEGRSEFWA